MSGVGRVCTSCDVYLCCLMDQEINVTFDDSGVKVSAVSEPIFDPNDTDKIYPIMPSNQKVDRVRHTIDEMRKLGDSCPSSS